MEKKKDVEKLADVKQETKEQPLIHDFGNFNSQNLKNAFTPKVLVILALVIIVGIISGFMVSGKSSSNTSTSGLGSILSGSSTPKGTIIGSNDTQTFKDTAEGVLKEGGIDGEGAFHLVRPGGDSQNVYLTSSIVDLSKYVGQKIKVWGQTQKAQVAGWLMDVGRIEIE